MTKLLLTHTCSHAHADLPLGSSANLRSTRLARQCHSGFHHRHGDILAAVIRRERLWHEHV
jgi:hypothetical protein